MLGGAIGEFALNELDDTVYPIVDNVSRVEVCLEVQARVDVHISPQNAVDVEIR